MMRDDQTEMGGGQALFLTTQWSLLEAAASPDGDGDRVVIGTLLARYWKPVYCYFRRQGYGNEDAKDLTQGFLHEVVLGRDLVEQADRSKGRFRSFLLAALRHYTAVARHKDSAQKRIPASKLIPLDGVDDSGLSVACTEMTPEDSFNYTWFCDLLAQVLDEVKAGCFEGGKALHWHLFRERVLDPIMDKAEAPSMDDLCHKYGIRDPSTASNMIVTTKRRLHAALRHRLRGLVSSEEEVDSELAEIMQFLPRVAQDAS
jgi:hypothetical protein